MEPLELKKYENTAMQAAAEGVVLLRNEEQVLPLKEGEKIAVFGRCQIEYYRSGTGSGGAVTVAYSTNLIDGLRRNKEIIIDEELAEKYSVWLESNPFDNGGGGWAAEPWFQKDMPLTEEIVKNAAEKSDKAIFVIGRTAGEDKDNEEKEGSYLLTEQEKENLKCIIKQFEKVIVVLNVSNIIDMSFLKEDTEGHIKAVVYSWQGGMEGGYATADVLTGKVTPSGKLTDTIAESYSAYPSSKNYGDDNTNLYEEDIYVGYRYFETFCPDAVLYEFGFGLSYTDFSIHTEKVETVKNGEETEIRLQVRVKNEGNTYSGKEVVQVYYEAPQGCLGRPTRALAAFAKTKELAPQEEMQLTIAFPVNSMAAYDDSGCTGHKSCYVLESGEYRVYVGNSVRDAKPVQIDGKEAYDVAKTQVVKQLEEVLAPVQSLKRMKPGKRNENGVYEIVYENAPTRSVDMAARIEERLPKELPITGNKNYTLQQVADGTVSMEEFVAQLTKEELAIAVRGEGMGHPDVTQGTASAFGGVSDSLKEYGIPLACAADGPSGVRMENGNKARQLPIGTLLAATWNTELVKELYTFLGMEMVENQIDTLLGPGMNIHRDPMNGRNFEYYSEDPFMTGVMAAAASGGIHAGGGFATIKHFACNNQEKRRSFIDAVVSERAVREIYLKGYEMAVRDGNVLSIMTSYNPINGHFAASNYDLNTTVLRKEWGYTGIVMTDWWAKMNDVVDGGEATVQKTRDMIRAQNDLYMVINNYGAEINANNDDTLEALEQGRLTVGELQRNVMNICNFLIKTESFKRVGTEAEEIPVLEPLEEDFEMAEGVVGYNISEQSVVNVQMEKETYIKVEEDGIYYLIANIMSEDSNMFQTTAEIMINQEPAAFIQTQGTMGKWIVQKLQKNILKKGTYCVLPKVVKPHLEIQSIEFKFYKPI
ncbi:MAG: glycoside hydrolase family 3 protein [Lachnospiraceae bacterium]|nr:glycoside hydrolase family 3 protein [Lachnospiraceae bacterium]